MLDREGRVFAALFGHPRQNNKDGTRPLDPEYQEATKRLSRTLEWARDQARQSAKYGRRGDFDSISIGISYGGGQGVRVQPLILLFRPYQKFQRPQSLKVSGVKAKLAQALVEDKDVNRVVGFQSGRLVFTLGWLSPYHYPGGLSSFFPRAYWNALDVLGKLQQNDWSLRRNFINSIYPACTFNLGPRTVCFPHNDSSNYPGIPCAITALGNFDPDKGGNLVIWDLMIRIRFPPGATILIPSTGL